MLNQSTYFFQEVKAQVNIIWWNWYTTPYQKHCFITVKTQKNRVLSIGPSGILAVNIVRTTIHSSYGIKSGIKLLSLKDESKAVLKNRLWEVTFLTIPPVRGNIIFSKSSDKDIMRNLLDLQLWHSFKYAELTGVVRHKDKLFMDLFNKFRIGNTLIMMLESYSRQDLYMNLMKTIQKMLCPCMQRMNLPWKGMMLI